jgi:hypothetical protein
MFFPKPGIYHSTNISAGGTGGVTDMNNIYLQF